jgi:hypothetical protein
MFIPDPDNYPVLRIRNPMPLDPGIGMCKKSGSGSMIRIRDEQPGSCFRELRNNFCLFKIHFMMWIQDSGSGIWDEKKIGSGMENF